MNHRSLLRPATGLLLLLAIPAHAQSPIVRDSAGIRIVASTRPLLPGARAWRVEPRPFLELGAGDAATAGDSLYEFALVAGVARLDDGRLAVAVGASHAIRFYDASGRFTGSAGRRGQGPGEFQQLLGMSRVAGDTLFVTDLDGVELFAPDGRFLAQGASRRSLPAGFIWPEAVLADRGYLGMDWNSMVAPPAGRQERRVTLFRISPDGSRRDSVGTVILQAGIFDGRRPFGIEPEFSPRAMLASDGRRVFHAFPTRYEVTELTPGGRVVQVIRRQAQRVPVSREAREEQRRLVLAQPNETGGPMTAEQRTFLERRLDQAGFAEFYPAFGAIQADRDGNLWVRWFDPRERAPRSGMLRPLVLPGRTTWDVFDPRGQWLTTVELPPRFVALEFGRDYIAGVALDADDVELVRVYRLLKP